MSTENPTQTITASPTLRITERGLYSPSKYYWQSLCVELPGFTLTESTLMSSFSMGIEGVEETSLLRWSFPGGISGNDTLFRKLGLLTCLSLKTPIRFKRRSTGALRQGRHEAMIPTISSTLAYMEGLMVACRGSPEPKLVNVVIFPAATPVASRPSAIRKLMNTFSEVGRVSVRMSLIGMRERIRSMVTYIANNNQQTPVRTRRRSHRTSNRPSVIDNVRHIPALHVFHKLPARG